MSGCGALLFLKEMGPSVPQDGRSAILYGIAHILVDCVGGLWLFSITPTKEAETNL